MHAWSINGVSSRERESVRVRACPSEWVSMPLWKSKSCTREREREREIEIEREREMAHEQEREKVRVKCIQALGSENSYKTSRFGNKSRLNRNVISTRARFQLCKKAFGLNDYNVTVLNSVFLSFFLAVIFYNRRA